MPRPHGEAPPPPTSNTNLWGGARNRSPSSLFPSLDGPWERAQPPPGGCGAGDAFRVGGGERGGVEAVCPPPPQGLWTFWAPPRPFRVFKALRSHSLSAPSFFLGGGAGRGLTCSPRPIEPPFLPQSGGAEGRGAALRTFSPLPSLSHLTPFIFLWGPTLGSPPPHPLPNYFFHLESPANGCALSQSRGLCLPRTT